MIKFELGAEYRHRICGTLHLCYEIDIIKQYYWFQGVGKLTYDGACKCFEINDSGGEQQVSIHAPAGGATKEEIHPGYLLEEAPESDLTIAYLIGYEKAKDEYKPRWRKYPEEKPNHAQSILCTDGKSMWSDIYLFSLRKGIVKITHWMPIPEIGE